MTYFFKARSNVTSQSVHLPHSDTDSASSRNSFDKMCRNIGYRNFDQVGTNSAMTNVLVLSAKVRRN